jgi:flagellin FlaB
MANLKKLKKSRRGEIGVGTLIIFIAMILVAAVAASVLISTANSVREQAESTGTDAINNVASGFVVMDVVGLQAADEVTDVYMYARLAAGSPAVNISDVVLTFTDETSTYTLTYAAAAAAGVSFGVDWVHIGEGLDNTYVGQGDLINISVTGLTLEPRTHVEITIMPEGGAETVEEFTTPSTYLTTFIDLD